MRRQLALSMSASSTPEEVSRNAKRAAEEETDAESEAEAQESEEDVAPVASTEPAKA